MSKLPSVSVIVPNYNYARYLDQRLESILNQTYRNIEVIILDDSSTDNSIQVIGKYKSDPRIVNVVVNEKNSGNTFLQWDKGLHLAKGELVWIAESDDYCEPVLLEELVKEYVRHSNVAISYSPPVWVYEDGSVMYPQKKGRCFCLEGRDYLKRYLMLACTICNASCAIFSRELALTVSDKYQSLAGTGDYMFWSELATKGKVLVVNKAISYFRRHNSTVTSVNESKGINFRNEKLIFDYILSQIRVSGFRIRFAKAYTMRMISEAYFLETEELRNELMELWSVKKYNVMDRLLYRIARSLRLRFNYYV